MVLNSILIIVSFIILVKSADYLVEGSSAVAKKFGISEFVIGVTIVALGTSAPELIVNIISSLAGRNELALGNIVGSNISNVLLVLGIAGCIYPLSVQKSSVKFDIPFCIFVGFILAVIFNDKLIDNAPSSVISRIDGIILISFFVMYMVYTIVTSKTETIDEADIENFNTFSFIKIFGGLIGLPIGGHMIVENATSIAVGFGVSEALIGLTVVAIGTSLPELVTSAVAAMQKKPDLAIGNVIGSNILNVLFVLGLSSIVSPIELKSSGSISASALNVDFSVMILSTVFLLIFMFTGKKDKLDKWESALFVFGYIFYTIYIIHRG